MCVQFYNVVKIGFVYYISFFFVKGVWYLLYFILVVMDGLNVWKIDGMEVFVI